MKHFERNNRSARTAKALLMVTGGLLTAGLINPVSAQPGGGGGQMGNQQGGQGGWQQGGGQMGGGQQGGRQGGRGNRGQIREQMIKMQLERAGYTDTALQTAVIATVKTKETGRQSLYDAANALSEGLSDETATDQSVATLYDTFNSALATERVRVKTLEQQLDAQIQYSKDKRLTAVLTLAGVIGDALSYLNQSGGGQGGPGGMGMGGPGMGMGGQGMGGPGGGMGMGRQGGFNGGGGQNGGMGGPGGGMGGQNGGPPGPPMDF